MNRSSKPAYKGNRPESNNDPELEARSQVKTSKGQVRENIHRERYAASPAREIAGGHEHTDKW